MKRFGLMVVAIILLVGGLGLSQVYAAEYTTKEVVTIEADETVEDDLFIAASTIRIEGVVEGDVYAAGSQIAVNGTIEGDLFAAANTITINGEIEGGLRAASATLDMSSAQIGGGVTHFGASFSSSSDTNIGNGLLVFGETATIDGAIANGLTAFADKVTLLGSIGTETKVTSTELNIGESALISADITHRSDRDAEVAEGAVIDGELIQKVAPERAGLDATTLKYSFLAWSFLSVLLAGFVLLWVGRNPLHRSAEMATTRPLASFGSGILGLILVGPVATLLAFTIIGIPLALMLWVATIVGVFLSTIVSAVALGRTILSRTNPKHRPKLYGSFTIGLLAIYTLYIIPIVNVLVALVVVAGGFGSLLLHTTHSVRRQHTTKKS